MILNNSKRTQGYLGLALPFLPEKLLPGPEVHGQKATQQTPRP